MMAIDTPKPVSPDELHAVSAPIQGTLVALVLVWMATAPTDATPAVARIAGMSRTTTIARNPFAPIWRADRSATMYGARSILSLACWASTALRWMRWRMSVGVEPVSSFCVAANSATEGTLSWMKTWITSSREGAGLLAASSAVRSSDRSGASTTAAATLAVGVVAASAGAIVANNAMTPIRTKYLRDTVSPPGPIGPSSDVHGDEQRTPSASRGCRRVRARPTFRPYSSCSRCDAQTAPVLA
jgi:hypothetical protein